MLLTRETVKPSWGTTNLLWMKKNDDFYLRKASSRWVMMWLGGARGEARSRKDKDGQ